MATVEEVSQQLSTRGLTLHNVEWDTYCKLRDEPANDKFRMMYLDGDLTIVSPHLVHDTDARLTLYVITAVARARRVRIMAVGTTTLRKKGLTKLDGAGKEPDEGFFLRENATRMRPKETLDLAINPPPDLAVEVDNTANSAAALASYARIGVPEVWRFDLKAMFLSFMRLAGDHYEEVGRSVELPWLTPGDVVEALNARKGQPDDLDWFDWLDQWARALPEPE